MNKFLVYILLIVIIIAFSYINTRNIEGFGNSVTSNIQKHINKIKRNVRKKMNHHSNKIIEGLKRMKRKSGI